MERLSLNRIRSLFLEFYEAKGHLKRNSFPLVPQSDKSLLLINSGMAPMKPYFAGIATPPSKRMTTCQKCIRTADIENVGITSRHGTFFEMLGSFSFGDYFKEESIIWGWEFITEVLHLPVSQIWVSVYHEDEEAYKIWSEKVNFPKERIVRLGKEDNFWEIGSGPCGPCSEIYYDRGREFGCDDPNCKPGCDCDRFVEFWNHVFTQYNNNGKGVYTELDQKNIDTGMGLERLACIMQGVDSIFDVDTIATVLHQVEHLTGVSYGYGKKETDVSIRIITDHVRSATFMIGDKIPPGNEGRGYVLRRLIRRAARHGKKLGVEEPFLGKLVNTVIDTCGGAYPELEDQRLFIGKIVSIEEEKFISTLDQGMTIIDQWIEDLKGENKKQLEGYQVFKLHDTYGFPADITREIVEDVGFTIDEEGFKKAMEEQVLAGKKDAEQKDMAWEGDDLSHIFSLNTKFTGYEKVTDTGEVLGLLKENKPVHSLSMDETGNIILDQTSFYAEGGGQDSDKGMLYTDSFAAEVTHVEKVKNAYLHHVKVEKGECTVGDVLTAMIREPIRNNSARNHTATHMLHKALREVLGDHVTQAGSFVNAKGLRFDFHHYEGVSKEDIDKIERIVNDNINFFLPVFVEEMTFADAQEAGAIGLFEDKYGDKVRVVSIGSFSKELCGGIHVENSGQIGAFKILSESGIASGVRRIEAITGLELYNRYIKQQRIVTESVERLKTEPSQLVEKIDHLMKNYKEVSRQLEELEMASLASSSGDMIKDAKTINGVRLLAKSFEDMEIDKLRILSDELKKSEDNLAMVFASISKGKVIFLVSLTDDVVGKGYHAGKMIKEVAKIAGGGGGGKADMAQAGGKDLSKVKEALSFSEKLL